MEEVTIRSLMFGLLTFTIVIIGMQMFASDIFFQNPNITPENKSYEFVEKINATTTKMKESLKPDAISQIPIVGGVWTGGKAAASVVGVIFTDMPGILNYMTGSIAEEFGVGWVIPIVLAAVAVFIVFSVLRGILHWEV